MTTTSPVSPKPAPAPGRFEVAVARCPYSRLVVAFSMQTLGVVLTDQGGTPSVFQPLGGA